MRLSFGALVLAQALLLASCAKQPNNVKVLNATNCFSDNCPSKQERWQHCIDSGFAESLPKDSKVISGRDYNELIEYEFSLGKTEDKKYSEKIDEQGIVFYEEAGSTTREIKSNAKQYCIGSEYILEG
jgi:hypothetical protein